MKKIYTILALLAFSLLMPSPISARKDRKVKVKPVDSLSIEFAVDTLTDAYLDTLDINKKLLINDYSMIGISYGGALNMVNFNPTRKNATFFTPHQFGITFTNYQKMFHYMPYFGIQVGLYYGQDGYQFKPDSDGKSYHVDGATSAIYDYIEVPALAHLHIDVWKIKMMVNLGLYGGYRLKVHREGPQVPEDYVNAFYDYENRVDYGFKGGLGIGFMFDPVEFHINATLRHSLSSLYEPDYASEYYYKIAYPMSVALTFGVHIHLTKRSGKTRSQLKQEAYDIVFNAPVEEEKEKVEEPAVPVELAPVPEPEVSPEPVVKAQADSVVALPPKPKEFKRGSFNIKVDDTKKSKN